MSTLILHDKSNNNWGSLGLGPLSDAINPLVTRGKNSSYELTFDYPVNGPMFKELKIGRWIVTDAGPTIQAQNQRLEIASISKPIKGIVSVYCEHYRYQLLRTIVKTGAEYGNIPAQTALNYLKNQMEPKGEFTFYSDILTRGNISFADPSKYANAQEVLGGVEGSILDTYGGEYVFNNNQVQLFASAGTEKNVVIAYGKNLTDIVQEESIENTYSSVYGWARIGNGEDEKIITLPETYLDSDYVGNYTQRRIQMVDFSDKEPQTVDQLRTLVKNFIKNNKVGVPKVSIKASFVDLASSVISGDLRTLEEVDLCDYVTVAFNELDINTEAQIVKTVWNVHLNRYESIELGEARSSFAKVIIDSQPDVKEIINKVDWLEKAQKEASDIIKNPGKGHVVIYPSIADPQELLILDTTSINTAKKVWRWNIGGLGFSSTGYNGTYGLAMTNNGAIVADRMTTGTLRAISIIGVSITGTTIDGSIITSSNGYNRIILADGTIKNYYGNIIRSVLSPTDFKVNDSNGINLMTLDSRGISMNKQSSSTPLGGLGRGSDKATSKEEIHIYAETGNIASLGVKEGGSTTDIIRKFAVSSAGAHISNLIMGGSYVGGSGEISNAYLKNTGVTSSFTVYNNVPLGFYSNLNMNGYSILNQSDIRLKENIEATTVNGIKETKKIQMVDYDWRQNYRSTDVKLQPPKERQFGMIAQYSPFLSTKSEEDAYLKIDVNKQINLNTLTNQELISIVEEQEKRLSRLEQLLGVEKEVSDGV
ncbi:phage tail spike protein [Enterococcus termitis]|uniref:Peptidase S74 domain-containing protein n=1 Tax=Enterococcus termitis TaxID=332950 RepID=A0A1E5GIC9_9ENTE|nr:phage tail spike protein [Enterococcus termitis]OEG12458.1 hypothetical protein BCR25_07940 [Enterococcus termitis]